MAFFHTVPVYRLASFPLLSARTAPYRPPAYIVAYRPSLPACLLYTIADRPILTAHPARSISPRPPLRPAAPQIASPHIRRLAWTGSVAGRGAGRNNRLPASRHPANCADIMETVFPGCVPASVLIYYIYRHGLVAQSGEQQLCKLKDAGSSPA